MRSKFLLMGAILAGVAMVSPARADFQLEYSINGGTFNTVTGSGFRYCRRPLLRRCVGWKFDDHCYGFRHHDSNVLEP